MNLVKLLASPAGTLEDWVVPQNPMEFVDIVVNQIKLLESLASLFHSPAVILVDQALFFVNPVRILEYLEVPLEVLVDLPENQVGLLLL